MTQLSITTLKKMVSGMICLSLALWGFGQEIMQKPCNIELKSLSMQSGVPGDVFIMYGTWGISQGTKIPCINKGKMNRLTVLSWTDSALKVKIPAGLEPGIYKVGVYCSDPAKGSTYSSGWKDFNLGVAAHEGQALKPTYDVDISDIYVDDKCRLWIKHTNKGTKPLNMVLRERVWVDDRLIDDSRETIRLDAGCWISHGVLADPGYIVSGHVKVKAQIDVDNALVEANEINNIMVKHIRCKKTQVPLNLKK